MIWTMFWSFFRIGLFTIGGGYAMIPLIAREMVGNGWMTTQEITDLVAIAQMTPGPFAVNSATFAGMKSLGIWGAVACTIGVTLPSLLIVILVSRYFFKVQKHRFVQGTLWGIKAVVLALVGSSIWLVGREALLPQNAGSVMAYIKALDPWAFVIFAVTLLGLIRFKVNPIIMIMVSGAMGILFYMLL